MRRLVTMLRVYYAYMAEYRAELFLWAMANLLPFIMMGLWMQAVQGDAGIAGGGAGATSGVTSGGGGGGFGFTPVMIARYFIVLFIVRQLTIVWVIWEFEDMVVRGRLSPYLLQPQDPVWRLVTMHLSEQAARVPFAVALVVIALALYPQAFFVPSAANLGLAVLAVYAAFVVRFLMQYTVAMLCFWFERAAGIEQLMFLPYLFLSGSIAPLDAFPPAVRTVALWTPFPYLLYFPVRLLMGLDTPAGHISLLRGFGMLTLWLAGLALLNRWAWSRGVRHYSAMGA